MNTEPEAPPLADPNSTAPIVKEAPRIPRAKGCALPMFVALGSLALAFGIVIVLTVLGYGVVPLASGNGRTLDPDAALGTLLAAIFGALCCWGGYHFLRLAFGNE